MANVDTLKQAFRNDAKADRRALRAAKTRAQALSPARILTQVVFLPVAIVAITVSIYVRTSPFERTDALRHLLALAGCETAEALGLAPAFKGEIGYHTRNDPDGDGEACPVHVTGHVAVDAAPVDVPQSETRTVSGAKFLRP